MHITDLPIIVLERIISYSLRIERYTTRSWKKNLNLLTICHKLREIGIPVVYRTAYICNGIEDSNGFNCKSDFGYTNDTAGITNIGLIKFMKYTNVVKRIVVDINNHEYFNYLLEHYDSIFEFSSCKWDRIKLIGLFLYGIHSAQSHVLQEPKILKLAHAFKCYIPNVTKLTFIAENSSPNIVLFCNNLLSVYASQLLNATYDSCLTTNNIDTLSFIVMQNSNDCSDIPSGRKYFNVEKLKKFQVTLTMAQLTQHIPHYLQKFNQFYVFNKMEELTVFLSNNSHTLAYAKNDFSYQKHLQFPLLKKLNIAIDSFVQLAEVVQLNYFDFPQLEELCINIKMHGNPIIDDSYSDYDIKRMSLSIVKILSQLMPQLKNLEIYCPKLHQQNVPVFSNIINHYHNQLSHLMIKQIIPCPPQPFAVLTFLSVSVTQITQYKFIELNSATLKYLEMEDVPHLFTWKDLHTNSVNNSVQYPSLQILRLVYNSESELPPVDRLIEWSCISSSNSTFNVICPNLETITILEASYISIHNVFKYFDKVASVTSINIEYSNNVNSRINTDMLNSTVFSKALGQLGYKILSSMPGIHDLVYTTNVIGTFNDTCFGILNNGYSKQLKHVESDVCVPLDNLIYTPALETAHLAVSNEITHDSPQLYGANLNNFKLIDNSGLFSWTWFGGNKMDEYLEFNNIIKCHIQVFKNTGNISNNVSNAHLNRVSTVKKIFMPNVDSFVFEAFNFNTKASATELYTGTSDNIILIGPLNALPTRGNANSDILGNLEVTVKSANADTEEHFYNVINSWFGYRKPLGACDLVLEDVKFDIAPERMCWKNVSKLEFGYAIKCTVLLQILPHLPNLKCLNIDQLVDDCSDNCSLSNGLISTSITEITIEDFEMANTQNMVGMTLLLIGITSLKSFSIENMGMDTAAFVEGYRHYYPHVANITFS